MVDDKKQDYIRTGTGITYDTGAEMYGCMSMDSILADKNIVSKCLHLQ